MRLQIDNDKFIFSYENLFCENLKNWEDLSWLLSRSLLDLGTEIINSYEQLAYILATVKHETANTYRPIKEYGRGIGRPYGKLDPTTGKAYYGRGFIQLTWKENYKKIGDLLGINLVEDPDKALDKEIAYRILVVGLDKGLYGADIDTYINNKLIDFVGARRCVNGSDRAKLIAGYADKFLEILNRSKNG
jgi:putative chitinase